MPIAQWNILNRASDGREAKGAVPAGTLVRRGADAAVVLSLAIPAAYLAVVAAALIGCRWYGRRATPPGRTPCSGRRPRA